MGAINIIQNTDKNINVTLRDENGDPINLDTATEIKACFKGIGSADPVELGIPIDEVQLISFSAVPDAGNFRLTHDGNETVDIAFGDSNTDVQTALNALASLSAVTVTGDFTNGFVVTFAGADGSKDQPLLLATTVTLTLVSVPVVVTPSTTTAGRKAGIVEIDFTIGKFRIELKKVDTLLLETGDGKDLEIQWVVAGLCNAKQSKGVLNVSASLCS